MKRINPLRSLTILITQLVDEVLRLRVIFTDVVLTIETKFHLLLTLFITIDKSIGSRQTI